MREFENTSLPDVIELRNVSQIYDNKKVVFENLHFLIEDLPNRGQFVSLLGLSGCGKSTILRYIAGLQKPTSGEILINGEVVTGSQNVAMVFQQYSSLPWKTVYGNIALGLEYQGVKDQLRVMKLIDDVGLTGLENQYCNPLVLSGGQLQRVAIARSLAINPNILLLDEPFGALDIMTRMEMQELVIRLWEKYQMTIILVTHDISEALYLGDEIWIVKNKKIGERYVPDLPMKRVPELKTHSKFTACIGELTNLLLKED